MSELIKAVEAAAVEALTPLGFRKRGLFLEIGVAAGVRGMLGFVRDARGGEVRLNPALHMHQEQLERLRAELWRQKPYDRSSGSIHMDQVNPKRPVYVFRTPAEAPVVMAELAADVERLGLPWLAQGSTLESTKKAEVEAQRAAPSADEWTVNTANATLERLGRIEARLLAIPAGPPRLG